MEKMSESSPATVKTEEMIGKFYMQQQYANPQKIFTSFAPNVMLQQTRQLFPIYIKLRECMLYYYPHKNQVLCKPI